MCDTLWFVIKNTNLVIVIIWPNFLRAPPFSLSVPSLQPQWERSSLAYCLATFPSLPKVAHEKLNLKNFIINLIKILIRREDNSAAIQVEQSKVIQTFTQEPFAL